MTHRSDLKGNPFRCFNSSPEVIRMAVMLYLHFPLSLRNVEDLLFEHGVDICHETVRFQQLGAPISPAQSSYLRASA